MAKITLRLPDRLLEQMRLRGQDERRSLNAVAVDALRHGLGETVEEPSLNEILGTMIVRPASRAHDPAAIGLDPTPGRTLDLLGALDDSRQDR